MRSIEFFFNEFTTVHDPLRETFVNKKKVANISNTFEKMSSYTSYISYGCRYATNLNKKAEQNV